MMNNENKDLLPNRKKLSLEEKQRFFEGRTFKHQVFAEFILENEKFVRIGSELFVFNGKVYEQTKDVLERILIAYIPDLRTNQRNEVTKYIELVCTDSVSLKAHSNYIAFNNGIFDLEKNSLLPFNDNYIVTNLIPHNYNEQAYSKEVDNVLSKLACYDVECRALLEEAVGYCFLRKSEMSRAFILVGDKANGKSTYLSMIQQLLGESNYTSQDLDEIHERFFKIALNGKLACIGDDINSNALTGKTASMFKKMVSGSKLLAEYKGKDAQQIGLYCKFFFSCNTIPYMDNSTGAISRRLVIIPMNARFTKQDKDYDPFIISKLTTETAMEYLIQLALNGLKRVLENNDFTLPTTSKEALAEYEEENDNVIQFANYYGMDSPSNIQNIQNISISSIYADYNDYCNQNQLRAVQRYKFTRTICSKYNLKTGVARIGDKTIRVFVPK